MVSKKLFSAVLATLVILSISWRVKCRFSTGVYYDNYYDNSDGNY